VREYNHSQRQAADSAEEQNETLLRDKREVSLGLPKDGTSGSDEYSTPLWLLAVLIALFRLMFDVATSLANPNNRLFNGFYALGRGEDGLTLPWLGRIFCNPPYSDLMAWTSKAAAEILAGNAEIVVMVLPCRLGNDWFFKNIYHCDFCQWFPLRDRVAFGGRDGGGNFDTIVAVWRRPGTPPVVDERALSLAIGEARAEHYAQREAARRADRERKKSVRLMRKA